MMRRVLLALLLALPLSAFAADYRMDAAQSQLGFAGTVQGESFEGRFAAFSADIRFDPESLSESRFDVRIDLASADSQNEERDSTLKGEEFFAVERLPQANYRAEHFRRLDDGRFVADGELTLRGITRPVSLRFRWIPGNPARLQGEAEIKRLDFAVGGGDWADEDAIANAVRVVTSLTLNP
ncbi:MAG: YceI family protein [Xanthomonadaceae bacterium]|nr:YceI family protein [Xanthomonadaceae bacterium]MDP2185072.1 YceI family protein [Xanthomonadales bacterium]MDZ4117104.1 YceI family protein [Xanthomonadaceae bacterium]MDZ4379460.1 YceI family protein [Xanthomonadaceae bacterium]